MLEIKSVGYNQILSRMEQLDRIQESFTSRIQTRRT